MLKHALGASILLFAGSSPSFAGLIGNSLDCKSTKTFQVCTNGTCSLTKPVTGVLKYYVGNNGNLYDYSGSKSGNVFPNGKSKKFDGFAIRANWTDTLLVMVSEGDKLTIRKEIRYANNRVVATETAKSSLPGVKLSSSSIQCRLKQGNAFQ